MKTLDQRLIDHPALTSVLMDYGWFVAPYITGNEYDRIKALVAGIQANPPANDAEKRTIEDKIHYEFLDVAFSNQVRARYVWQALRTPHLRDFSHLYESAILSYYKREYAGAVCLLLVAFEGILLSISGWQFGGTNKKPSFKQLKNKVATLPLINANPHIDTIQAWHRDALTQFVSRWLYSETKSADFTVSVLNRHYVLHGMKAGNFYRPQDMHRLLLAFDLLIDIISISEGTYRPMIETNLVQYEIRQLFYDDLRSGILTLNDVFNGEQVLLKQHPNYEPPTHEACEELKFKR